MTTQKYHICQCGGVLRKFDEAGCTLQCAECKHCSLLITWTKPHRLIYLADFHLKRGDGPQQRPIDDLGMASRLVESLVLDEWPSPATITDYGIESARHLGALQAAVDSGCTAYDFDRVIGDGPAITDLVRCVPEQPYGPLTFETPYDDLFLQKLISNEE